MSYSIDIHPSNTLRIKFSGEINLEELDSVRENVLSIVRANKLEYILCNLHSAFFDIKEMELFSFAASNRRLYRKIKKTAIIYSAGIHDIRDLTWYSTTVNNKGFRVKLFQREEDAIKWLKF
jgi:hypothetical protein